MQTNQNIAFIGAGNMATAIIRGLQAQQYPAAKLHVANPTSAKLLLLQQLHPLNTYTDNKQCIAKADIIIICVKPQILPQVLHELKDQLCQSEPVSQPLLISVAAGVRTDSIEACLNTSIRLIRAMPNTPASIGFAATGLYANCNATDADKQIAADIFNAIGISAWLTQEADLDTITAVTGSGPAYVFYFMQALTEAAIHQGLPEELATTFTQQLFLGCVELASQSSQSLGELRSQVTSPNGTTAAGVGELDRADLKGLMQKVVESAATRAEVLGDEFAASIKATKP